MDTQLTVVEQQVLSDSSVGVSSNNVPWFMRFFAFMGSLMALVVVLVFLAIMSFFDTAALVGVTGVISLGLGVWGTRVVRDNVILDPLLQLLMILGRSFLIFVVTSNSTGDILISIGILLLVMEPILFVLTPSIMQRFISTILLVIAPILLLQNEYSLVILGAIACVGSIEMRFNAGSFIQLQKKYGPILNPARFALLLSAIVIIFIENREEYMWLPIITSSILIIYLIPLLKQIIPSNVKSKNVNVIIGITVLMMLPTIQTPGVVMSVLFMFAGFHFSEKIVTTLGMMLFIVFLSWFYYSMELSLMYKSIILMVSGLFFIGGYALIQKQWKIGSDA